MRKGSIAGTLFYISVAWLVLALAATAFLLSELYGRALDTSLQETLEFHLLTLDGIVISGGTQGQEDTSLGDPRFSAPLSGWYWQVQERDGEILAVSPSLTGSVLPKLSGPFGFDRSRTAVLGDGNGTQVRLIERRVTVAGADYVVSVSGNLDEIYELVADFRGQAFIVLGAVGVMLAVMSAMVARFALRPVSRLRNAVERIREGDSEKIDGHYPAEIAPLAEEINELLRSNSQIIERARNQVGNLAHGLKTPIAVLRNESAGKRSALGKIVLSETEKMTGMVSTYLDRARLAARTSVIGKKANATEILDSLVRVMGKIYPEKDVILVPPGTSQIWFRGEEADLEEMVGNLLDNACKWAKTKVRMTCIQEQVDAGAQIIIAIEDDGAGLEQHAIEAALKRGVRLDEKTPGSGLGLDIVKELADVYGGSLRLSAGGLGGLKAQLTLPAVRQLRS